MTPPTLKKFLAPITFLFALALAACGVDLGLAPTPTPTPIPTPTETPIPLAASVNGESITIAEFEAELARYQQAQASLGNTVSLETATQAVLNDMIDTVLLAQAAAAYGLVVDDATVQSRVDALAAQVGGPDALAAWESAHGYTDADFRSALRRQIAAAWMRDQIAASVSSTAEQVHVKQILLYNADDAQQALGFLQAGWNFDDLAARYDPVTKGELGWFPRGYLPAPAIEDAAFALQTGLYSAIVQDETGYHLLYVVERDPARLLSPDALLTLQERAVQSWLTQRRNESTILIAP
ncbi:MAG: SurA N-terminal domain-containing protein [Candidatus Atribacteria bacterium]|nr:SurA N-terminal domain-containing protein [Candidatus Atribacteria bacterium]